MDYWNLVRLTKPSDYQNRLWAVLMTGRLVIEVLKLCLNSKMLTKNMIHSKHEYTRIYSNTLDIRGLERSITRLVLLDSYYLNRSIIQLKLLK